ncbi:YrvL family regulatory protein [Kurthia huakuii]|uniref:YrvL family regulatory protein n=1 Tax=Kurthia huakuii TaxID=1421019 RepID=UPI0004984F6D|nr:YrvL family regulatory protein [Kurthia huakuii]MBM7700493.1 hypothetical protein [Kurthia huakuii]
MKEKIAIFVSMLLVGLLFVGIGAIEFFALKIVGLQYTTLAMGLLFIVLYGVLDFGISLFMGAVPSVLVELELLEEKYRAGLDFVIDYFLALSLIGLLDAFMPSISISLYGTAIFALLTAIIHYKLNIHSDEDSKPT